MARIIGGLGTSHVPSIGVALDRGLADGPDWKPLFDGYAMPQQWMRDHKPDIAVVIFNDHGNSFFLDRVPTFAVGVADSYKPVDEGWGPRAIPDFDGAADLGWHFADRLVERHFDPLVGRYSDSAGIATRISSVTSIASQNGNTPRKMSASGTLGATDLTMKTLIPTGGEISPISSVSTTSTPNQIRSIPSPLTIGTKIGRVSTSMAKPSTARAAPCRGAGCTAGTPSP